MPIVYTALLFLTVQEVPAVEWVIDGVKREGLVFAPTQKNAAGPPLVFVFHGHGGTMQNTARKFGIHKLWPEAVVVYLQGLPTPGKFDPDGKKPGWQHGVGEQKDRDLHLFDAVLKDMRAKHRINDGRVYATGHSNGGGFTYLLWAARPDVFAAVAPSAAGGRNLKSLKPLPAMHLAGEKDATVPFANQNRVMEVVRQINGCDEQGKEWAKGCTIYTSAKGTPFVSYIHPGAHAFPEEAAPLIVRFFKEHSRSKVKEK